jgi:hypothetical protein
MVAQGLTGATIGEPGDRSRWLYRDGADGRGTNLNHGTDVPEAVGGQSLPVPSLLKPRSVVPDG